MDQEIQGYQAYAGERKEQVGGLNALQIAARNCWNTFMTVFLCYTSLCHKIMVMHSPQESGSPAFPITFTHELDDVALKNKM